MCVDVCVDCDWPPFGCGSVGGSNVGVCWGGVGRRVDKGDSTLKPTKLQKQ